MLKISRWTMAHRRLVVAAWIAIAVGLMGVATSVGSSYSTDFTAPGSGSQREADLLNSRFPGRAGDQDQIVFQARKGKLSDSADKQAITATLSKVARVPHVKGIVGPYASGVHAISRDGTIGFATVQFDETASALPVAAVNQVISTADSARSESLNVQLGGQAIENAIKPSVGFSTAVGVIAAIVILLISFGSLVATSLPLITAAAGVIAGYGAIELASHAFGMPNFAPELALMIGLGVGVDYALFIVTRFRENYRTNGGNVDEAVAMAFNTAGRAVLFAGLTVVIALLGMFALGVSMLNGLATASALVVAFVVAASTTLLPPLLRLTGHRVGRVHQPRHRGSRPTGPARPGFWTRWVGHVQRHPAATAIAAAAIVLAIASPFLGIRMGQSDAGNDSTSSTTRQAYDLMAKGFGPGFNGPLQIAVALPSPNDQAAVTHVANALTGASGIASVTPARVSPDGSTAAITAYPTTSPQSAQTTTLVNQLRRTVLPPAEHATGAKAYVGGPTANAIDFSHVLSSKLPVFMAVVIGLGALLLLFVFRSLVIPLQAAIMNVLTIGASLGVLTLVFQHGDLGTLFSAQAGPIDAFIPVMAFAIIFGLSTDYEVFLVSRVHEEWQKRRDPSAAITEGVGHTARVVVAAAAVMFCVFFAFAVAGNRTLGEFGLALASAVFLDVLLMRLLLLPAVLQLLGRTTWRLPGPLQRHLPHIAIEPKPSVPPVRPEPVLEAQS